MTVSATRKILWTAFFACAALALLDLLWTQNLFLGLILLPLLLVIGGANVGAALWNKEGRSALLTAVITLALCGGYVALLAFTPTVI